MIAALDTYGSLYTALTQENTDSVVFMTFLSRLVLVLNKENKDWRSDTIFLLDGA